MSAGNPQNHPPELTPSIKKPTKIGVNVGDPQGAAGIGSKSKPQPGLGTKKGK